MMKKVDKKGFTLIELLAVVVILLAISVVAISSISAAIERNKIKQNDAKKKVIENYAELYYKERKNTLPSDGCITIEILADEGYLSDSEKVDVNGDNFTGGVDYTNGSNFTFVESCS